MAVGLQDLPEMHPVNGVRLGVAAAGIKKQGSNDLMLMELCDGSVTASVFTQNAFCAAPVIVAKDHISKAIPAYYIVNSGNANGGTGDAGIEDAIASCTSLASLVGCNKEQVLPFSTGVIGQRLPVDKISKALPAAVEVLEADAWLDAAKAIMTTDTMPKGVSVQVDIAGATVTITGIAKGAGMIRPDMATMLAYIATDARVQESLLQDCLEHAVSRSFNRITIDGDTSTNDACMLVATAKADMPEINSKDEDYQAFSAAITDVCETLAQAVVRDGEGASKFITIQVEGGQDESECLQVAYTVAHSPLVKTAFFASDPNWGRILAAVGRAGLEDMDINAIEIYLDDVCIVRNGGCASDYREESGQQVMSQDEITVRIILGRGSEQSMIWTTDLSYDYVRINAEYRT